MKELHYLQVTAIKIHKHTFCPPIFEDSAGEVLADEGADLDPDAFFDDDDETLGEEDRPEGE